MGQTQVSDKRDTSIRQLQLKAGDVPLKLVCSLARSLPKIELQRHPPKGHLVHLKMLRADTAHLLSRSLARSWADFFGLPREYAVLRRQQKDRGITDEAPTT